jgi:hypothetical protein
MSEAPVLTRDRGFRYSGPGVTLCWGGWMEEEFRGGEGMAKATGALPAELARV